MQGEKTRRKGGARRERGGGGEGERVWIAVPTSDARECWRRQTETGRETARWVYHGMARMRGAALLVLCARAQAQDYSSCSADPSDPSLTEYDAGPPLSLPLCCPATLPLNHAVSPCLWLKIRLRKCRRPACLLQHHRLLARAKIQRGLGRGRFRVHGRSPYGLLLSVRPELFPGGGFNWGLHRADRLVHDV